MYFNEYHSPKTWIEKARWIEGKGLGESKLRRLCANTTVYHIWEARNLQIFEQKSVDADQIAAICISNIRDRVNSWRK
ncbi:hypothetical protein LIER_42392 [Lithospermum erythrorhizon]|uniref:Uncharacterized protein n=1 Tax=Lithospermum erythrorhizon TaxID=34254 RepID=A0AAV3RQP8_LITER